MIHVKNLHKSFGENKVLQGVNLDIEEGEIFCLLGASGSGKSVFVKHLIGLLHADEGQVVIDDDDMSTLEGSDLYQKLLDFGFIFQMGALFDFLNVEGNVGFYLKEHLYRGGKKIEKKDIAQYVNEALKNVGLEGTGELEVGDLSGGMRKRVSIARTLVYRPKIIIYDEPTTGLDPITAKKIAELIVSVQKELQGTSIVVTHDIVTALMISNRMALIENGVIKICGTPDEVMQTNHDTISYFNYMTGGNYQAIGKLN